MRMLIVEDELKMAKLIRRGLMADGLAADVALKGEDALWMAGSTTDTSTTRKPDARSRGRSVTASR
jgi:DNA-binding response OmpR family regulator